MERKKSFMCVAAAGVSCLLFSGCAENELRLSENAVKHLDSNITNNLMRPAEVETEEKVIKESLTRDEEALEIIARALESAESKEIIEESVPLTNSLEESKLIKKEKNENEKSVTEQSRKDTNKKNAAWSYSYREENCTMYASVELNVRNEPSSSGKKIGALKKNQEVQVCGQCIETDWYRIQYGDTVAYVSNKYLSNEKIVEPEPVAKSDQPENQSENQQAIQPTITQGATVTSGYDRAMAQQIFALVNQERASVGAAPLTWDENLYDYACSRAKTIVTDFSHDGCAAMYGENILMRAYGDECAQVLYQQWMDSPAHHSNYLDGRYDRSAISVYVINGQWYAVQNFILAGF